MDQKCFTAQSWYFIIIDRWPPTLELFCYQNFDPDWLLLGQLDHQPYAGDRTLYRITLPEFRIHSMSRTTTEAEWRLHITASALS